MFEVGVDDPVPVVGWCCWGAGGGPGVGVGHVVLASEIEQSVDQSVYMQLFRLPQP